MYYYSMAIQPLRTPAQKVVTRYMTIYIVDLYSNVTKDITKQIYYIT